MSIYKLENIDGILNITNYVNINSVDEFYHSSLTKEVYNILKDYDDKIEILERRFFNFLDNSNNMTGSQMKSIFIEIMKKVADCKINMMTDLIKKKCTVSFWLATTTFIVACKMQIHFISRTKTTISDNDRLNTVYEYLDTAIGRIDFVKEFLESNPIFKLNINAQYDVIRDLKEYITILRNQ